MISPPMIATAIGPRVSAPGPSASAGGIAAIMVARVVMRMGRSRTGPAFSIDSVAVSPRSR